ncbi:uncharacterized protein LOC111910071 [Lactuca sativa]|uniref:uncharacterized protein LOC111910071 n=1 Tax=Lactuca sativa TaxID=4236 RepID=UPI000CD94AFB|nr:uncharacterized protein LOC111910071 [Lactuca sativa]
MVSLKKKLQVLKKNLKEWNMQVRVDRLNDKDELIKKLLVLDKQVDPGCATSTNLENRRMLFKELMGIEKKDMDDLAQKAKIKWPIEGDDNTKFFHCILNNSRKQMAIRDIFKNGVWMDDLMTVKAKFLDQFSVRFAKPTTPMASVVHNFTYILSFEQVAALEADVSFEEIKKAVWDCDSFVSKEQFAFIKGRQILDGPFIMNEVLSWCKFKNKSDMVFKVDFEKAYDLVRWEFLDIMSRMEFGVRWRNWIQGCLSFSRGSVLVNGSPIEEFQLFRGLRQGDPLSCFMFILVMESLHVAFQKVVDNCLFCGISLDSSSSCCLSHLFYVDDAIFVGEWKDSNVKNIVRVLHSFFLALGLKINLNKSKLLGYEVLFRRLKIWLLLLDV